MAWYLVYPMILGHFQITRLMPGKYGGHSVDDIMKLILFIKMLYSDSNGNCSTHSEPAIIFAIPDNLSRKRISDRCAGHYY